MKISINTNNQINQNFGHKSLPALAKDARMAVKKQVPQTAPRKVPRRKVAPMLFESESLRKYLAEVESLEGIKKGWKSRLVDAAFVKRDQQAKKTLVQASLPVVVKTVQKYANKGIPMADLIQEGNLVLLNMFENYIPSESNPFLFALKNRIYAHLNDLVAVNVKSNSLPGIMSEHVGRLIQGRRQFSKTQGRVPSDFDLAKAIQMRPVHAYEIQDARSSQLFSHERRKPDELLACKQRNQIMLQEISALPPVQQVILWMDYQGYTRPEIVKMFGISAKSVCKVDKLTTERLRSSSLAQKLQDCI